MATDTMATDTMATDTISTDIVSTDSSPRYAIEYAAELQSLRSSQKAFDDARTTLDAERTRLADLRIRFHLIQRTLILLSL